MTRRHLPRHAAARARREQLEEAFALACSRDLELVWEFQESGALFGSPYNEDHSMLRSVFGPVIGGNSHVAVKYVRKRKGLAIPVTFGTM